MYVGGVAVTSLQGADSDRPAQLQPAKPSLAGAAMIKCGAVPNELKTDGSLGAWKASGRYPDWDQNEATWDEQVLKKHSTEATKYKKDLLSQAFSGTSRHA